MPHIRDRKLRFSDAAYAIDAPPKSLRNWLQREQVVLPGEHDGGWRAFSYLDIAVLALVRPLVEYGLLVREANDIAHAALNMFPQGFGIAELSPTGLTMLWTNRTLLVWRDGGGWRLHVSDNWQPAVPSSAYLALHVETIWRTAFDRAAESNSDGAVSEV